MPHIILKGEADLHCISETFQPQRADSNGWIIKLKNCFISSEASMLIFDCTAVRSGFSQDFYIRAEVKSGRITVRVDPYMRIEKNEGVQRAILAVTAVVNGGVDNPLPVDKSNLPAEVLGDISTAS